MRAAYASLHWQAQGEVDQPHQRPIHVLDDGVHLGFGFSHAAASVARCLDFRRSRKSGKSGYTVLTSGLQSAYNDLKFPNMDAFPRYVSDRQKDLLDSHCSDDDDFVSVAELEAGLISERTKAALKAAKARGVKLGRHGAEVLAPHYREEARQRAVQLAPIITELKGKGLSLARIAVELNKRKVATPRGGKWDHSSVGNVLQRLAA